MTNIGTDRSTLKLESVEKSKGKGEKKETNEKKGRGKGGMSPEQYERVKRER